MEKAFIYARVSSEEQAENGKSIEAQLSICTRWAHENDFTIEKSYIDRGKSATTINRPALQEMLTDTQMSDCSITAILVQDTDRLARDTFGHLTIKGILRKKGIRVISISQPLIDDTPEGNLIDTMLAATNAFQSQITGRKTKKVLEEKARLGWYPGGTAPIGYRNADNPSPKNKMESRIIVVDELLAPKVKECFEMYSTGGYSAKEIAQYLMSKGVTSPSGKAIHPSFVLNMLHNPFYTGRFKWNQTIYNGNHERIISDALFESVGNVIGLHGNNGSRKRKHNYLLIGHLWHADTHCRYFAEKHKKGGVIYDFYYPAKNRHGEYVITSKLEDRVQKIFEEIQLSPDYVEYVLHVAKEIVKDLHTNQDAERNLLQKRRNSIEKAMRELEDSRFISGTLNEEAFARIYPRYESELKQVKESEVALMGDHSDKIKMLEQVLRLAQNIGNAYRTADDQLKKQYIKMFIEKFYVRKKKIVSYVLTKKVKNAVEEGSVRIKKKWLLDKDSNLGPSA